MNRKLAWAIVLGFSLTVVAHGQPAAPFVTGQGTANYVPLWTGQRSIGNSILFQSGNSLGVGTTHPRGTLDIESNAFNGIFAVTSSAAPYASAVSAIATAGTVNGNGIYGETDTTGFGAGVSAVARADSGNAFGVFARANSSNGDALFGYASAASGYARGVHAFVESPNAVAGQFVTHAGAGLVLQGLSGANFNQVFYVDASGNGYFAGDLNVVGNLSKGSGSFKIDDPLDPANKTLSHSFVESPDMMNIYNGVVQLDATGAAWVNLPDYFEGLNRDFRYQLTAIGAPGPNLYIAQEIAGNRFLIEGGKPRAKVSWQVTGVRCDAYANAHRVPVEEDKAANERGYFLHPDAYGLPPSKGIESARSTQTGADVLAAAVATSGGRQAAAQ